MKNDNIVKLVNENISFTKNSRVFIMILSIKRSEFGL